MIFLILIFFSNKRCGHEEIILKGCVYWKSLFLKNYFFFCIFYPILSYDILDGTICLINADNILTLDNVDMSQGILSPHC